MGIIWAKQLQHTGRGLDDFFAKCFNGLLALRGEGDNDLPVVQGVGQTGDEALFLMRLSRAAMRAVLTTM